VTEIQDIIQLELLTRLIQGDQVAWYDFINTYERHIYTYLHKLEGHTEEALDLTQEVFYRAWRSIHTFHVGQRALPWLYKVALNTQIESHRRKRLQRFSLQEAQEIGFELISLFSTPVQAAESASIQIQVQSALMALTPEFREAIILRFIDELSYDEIARIQGVANGTAKSRVFRAKEQLAILLSYIGKSLY
jgi:RNA polymerase sigma-70 factor, ECF subfamily